MSVSGKVVVITGATRGIGRAVAERCVTEGASVVISGRTSEAVEATATELATPNTCLGVQTDVSDYQQVERLRDSALERFGRIDAWFNNAGISLGYKPFDEESADDLARIVDINLTGHLYGCRAILPYFREHGGYLLNMAGRGYRGEATPHTAAYAATKTAIASITLSLAAENKAISNLSINAVVPGMVATDFYKDIQVSPRLARTKDNWRFALDAFGVPLGTVAEKTAQYLGDTPGRESGRIYSLLPKSQTVRGIAKMAWLGMTGKMVRE